MKENQLNKKQKEWLEEFLETRPYNHYRVYTTTAGTRTIEIEWREEASVTILDDHTYIATKIKHKLVVVLRFNGHPIKSGKYSFDITPPQRYSVEYTLEGQLALDIPQHYEIKFPENPVTVKHRIRKPKNRNRFERSLPAQQHKLTLDKGSQALQNLNYQATGAIKSEDELLQTRKIGNIRLPDSIMKMLQEKSATEEELMYCSILFNSGNVEAVLNYINQIEQFREQIKKTVSRK
ncbi:hypothetical protein CAL7716_102290 (plasmid) [Calothrix sp. PCC 7716]|nr:hypothetical protein CAL7716_102290 [Calothrix sp. PCC 7716]